VIVSGDLAARLDVDDVEAECLGAECLAREAPGGSPTSLHLLELVDALDRVALSHRSSSSGLPLVSPGNRTYPLRVGEDSAQGLEEAIGRYNEAWNNHDLDAIIAMHAPDMVFENHTAGESAQGPDEVRKHIGSIFESWPDLHFETRRLYVRDGVVTQEWTASATHSNTMRRGDLVAEPTGKRIEWRGVDVIPYEDGLIKRKDVYSDSVSILRQVGLLD
jgi:steroid delta-isomerase-like uncharacterized protein